MTTSVRQVRIDKLTAGMSSVALQLATPEPSRARLAALVLQLAVRQRELALMRRELQALQARYLREIGGMQGQLFRLRSLVEVEEIRVGIRPPRVEEAPDDADKNDDGGPDEAMCSKEAPSTDMKRMFREIARMAHPDLAVDEATKYRRHSIMAEANRAYAERDEDRLRLLMRSWHYEPDPLVLDETADPVRIRRRVQHIVEVLAQLDLEAADLGQSAIAQLKIKMERTREQGWDLFANMIAQIKTDIGRETAKLIKLQRRGMPQTAEQR